MVLFKSRNTNISPLALSSEAELVQLSAETNMNVQQLQSTAQAQGAMLAAAEQTPHIEIPKVNFYPSQHANPRKRRRQDIRHAYRLLKPMKRSKFSPRRYLFGGKYRYAKNTAQCCVDGCDVDNLLRCIGNVYDEIRDEETGKSLWDTYFTDPVSGQPRAFLAREGVTSGRQMTATYCPEHLHLYDLLCQWEAEEEAEYERNKGTLKDKLKRGVSTVIVPISVVKKKDDTPEKLIKYEEFFKMARKDGIPIQHFTNRETGLNDMTVVVFDMRQFQRLGDNSPILHTASNTTSVQQPIAQAPAGAGLQMLLNQTQEHETVFNAPEVP
jgi:hypothetical protein